MLQFLAIVNLIVAVQAIFLFLHFSLKKKGITQLNRILALLCLCFAFILGNTFVSLYGIDTDSELLQDIANNVMWFIGPSLYLYVIYNQKNPSKTQLFSHTLPFLIPSVIDVFIPWPGYDAIIPFIAFVQMCLYLVISIRFCIIHYRVEKQFYSWVLPAIITFLILVVANFSLSVLRVMNIEIISSSLLQSFTALLVVPIFYIAYKEMNSTGTFDLPTKKYQTTPIAETKAIDILEKVKQRLEEQQMYLNKELTLAKFSSAIEIPSKYISQVINQQLGLSFSDYLTQLRIEDVKVNLLNPKKQHLTISGIAEEAGFASSSRFNHLFKKHTGLTPSEYLLKNKN